MRSLQQIAVKFAIESGTFWIFGFAVRFPLMKPPCPVSYLVPVRKRVVGLRGRDGGVEGGRQLPAQAVLDVGVEAEGEEDGGQLEVEPVQHGAREVGEGDGGRRAESGVGLFEAV